MASIQDNILEAIDTIVTTRINRVSYDKTILCEIVDASNAENGEYKVTDGSTTYVAYSENTTYTKGISVYVTIPNGDYNMQKWIVGRLTSDDSESVTYVSPLDSYFNVTGNILPSIDEAGLLANDDRTAVDEATLAAIQSAAASASTDREKTYYQNLYNEALTYGEKQEKILVNTYNDNAEEFDASLTTGLERLAITADFKTLINTCVTGNFGVRLEATITTPNGDRLTPSSQTAIFELDSTDMWGNPYNYSSYYTQTKVFDTSELLAESYISDYRLVFYQKQNFYVDNAEKFEYKISREAEKNNYLLPTEKYIYINNNIYINNIIISLGYALDDTEKAYLQTSDSLEFDADMSQEDIEKHITLRWNHIVDGEAVAIVSSAGIDKYITNNSSDGRDVEVL